MFRGHFAMSNCIITEGAQRPDSGYNYMEFENKIASIMSSAYLCLKLKISHITMASGKIYIHIYTYYMKYPTELL